ncbi:hypothetical protein PPERSA_03898 [Pseudocohnilembus persalinus]|uniref:Organic solute transporter Ost-alpha n=1 Tax=Pseudocohnilembus persalinus TaxID=266149 RepID=A0A0V0Q9A4_PSEPJ|nr:hypothetical protein PPERSA_03898 [Pseudocohnilembus persalinus]|eukprot:KRW98763.1 hypothetical protein PPERSA_03898 [Pseudocohnilembus persalinus]
MKHEKVYQLMLIPEKGDRQKLIKPLFPMSFCLSPYILSSESKASLFVVKCKKYVLICFIIKPVGALFQILANHYQWEKLQIVVQMIVVVSVCASLYYLVMFYQVIKKPLAPYNPLFKFLVIKITLFFTFWQEITLKITEPEILTCFSGASQRVDEQIMIGLENILVCFEMFIMSIVAGYAFTFHEFKIFGVNRGNFKGALQDMIDTFKTDVYVIQIKPNPIKHNTYEVPLNQYDGRISQTALGQQQYAQLRTSSVAEIEMTPQNTNQQIKKKKKDLNDYLLLNHH